MLLVVFESFYFGLQSVAHVLLVIARQGLDSLMNACLPGIVQTEG